MRKQLSAILRQLKIEPRSFDAHFGLGRSYRALGDTENAITALQIAVELEDGSYSATCELGFAYIDDGQYEAAEEIALPVWESEDMGAGLLLLTVYAAQGKSDEALALLENKSLAEHLSAQATEEIVRFGAYNTNGEYEGYGVGLYNGEFIYIGEYEANKRCGQGIWREISTNDWYFMGEWANDAPNGYGELFNMIAKSVISGNFVNGLEDGAMTITIDESHPYSFTAAAVKVVLLGQWTDESGQIYEKIGSSGLPGDSCSYPVGFAFDGWGVIPWGSVLG